MYRVRLDRPVGHLVGCKKVFSSILVLSNCFAKLCFLFGPRDRLLDVEKYLDFLLWFTRYNNQFQQNSGVGSPDKVEKIFKGILGLIPSPSPCLLGIVNKLFVFISLLTTPNNVLPSHLSRP